MRCVPCWLVSSALAGPIYERRGGELLGGQLADRLEEAYRGAGTVDRADLCVIPGQQCWILYVDALVTTSTSTC